jgi:predicted permease
VITVARAHDQQLVPCYAASVFASFLVGLLAMARLARRKRRHKSAVITPIAAIAAAFSSSSDFAVPFGVPQTGRSTLPQFP